MVRREDSLVLDLLTLGAMLWGAGFVAFMVLRAW